MRRITLIFVSLVLVLANVHHVFAFDDVIVIGFDIPLTGEFKVVGNYAKRTGELLLKQINAAGGIRVGEKTYKVEFLYGDNNSTPTGASNQVLSLVTKGKVLAIVGPLSSRQAVPAGGVANSFSTTMIAPTSTAPATTKDRPFVFRCGYVVEVQSPVLIKFASKEFGAKKAAILYDIVSDYPRSMAKNYKEVFEQINGPGSIVAYEEFRTGDVDFSNQLKKIIASNADILFTPQHYFEVPLIIRQAKALGWNKPIMGSNSWAVGNLAEECGKDCKGQFFAGNFAAGGVVGVAKQFVDVYQKEYNELPDEVSALTWDSIQLLLKAIQNTGGLTGKLLQDRLLIKDQLKILKKYDGVTGEITYKGSGNPDKCAVIIKIDDQGMFTHHETICP
ncbi:MAG: ABC transporter substrate-binding protein [Pseudomonadota bacterium]